MIALHINNWRKLLNVQKTQRKNHLPCISTDNYKMVQKWMRAKWMARIPFQWRVLSAYLQHPFSSREAAAPHPIGEDGRDPQPPALCTPPVWEVLGTSGAEVHLLSLPDLYFFPSVTLQLRGPRRHWSGLRPPAGSVAQASDEWVGMELRPEAQAYVKGQGLWGHS